MKKEQILIVSLRSSCFNASKLKTKLHAHLQFNLYISHISQIYPFYYYSIRNIKSDTIIKTGEILRRKKNYTSTP